MSGVERVVSEKVLSTGAVRTFMSAGAVRRAVRRPLSLLLVTTAIVAVAPSGAGAQHAVPAVAGDAAETGQIAKASFLMGEAPKEDVRAALEKQIVSGVFERELEEDFGRATVLSVRQAYARRVFEPIWTPEGANALHDALADHFSYGIVIDDFSLDEIESYMSARNSGTPAVRAAADIALTVAYVRLAAAISGGLADEGAAATSRTAAPSRSVLTGTILDAGNGDVHDALGTLEPDHPQYRALKKALLQYRDFHDRGGWPAIRSGALIRPGDRDPRIPSLRARLRSEGYDVQELILPAGDPAAQPPEISAIDVYDAALENGVRRFQTHHGLKEDGIVGPATLAALNENVESKIARIAESMNRWRRLGSMGARHVWVNIPSFTAQGWQDGRPEITMKTIVGQKSRQTPEFSDVIEYVVPNPRWIAPVSIVRRDKLPKLAKDPGYAVRGKYSIYSRATGERVDPYAVDWTDPSSARRYKFVQAPGEQNALGQLKIIFPNRHSVYLHGTPSKHLFDEAERTFSSGCIRLENPVGMAAWLARYDSTLKPEQIGKALEEKRRNWMKLGNKVPVHITYNTVTADGGEVYFWRDVYGRGADIRMAQTYAPLYTAGRDRTGERRVVSRSTAAD